MGHDTAIVKIAAASLPAHPTAKVIMDQAVTYWLENEADRHDSPRDHYPPLSPIASESVANYLVMEHTDRDRSTIVPLTDDYIEKTTAVRLKVTAKELAALRRGYYWDLIQEGRFGDSVTAVEITQLPKRRAPRAEATEGKTVTVYKVMQGNYPLRELKPFPTQAAARAGAIDFMEAHPEYSTLSVEAFVQRDTGKAALVTITRPEPEESTVVFKVTTQKPKPGAKITDYLVGFDYHS